MHVQVADVGLLRVGLQTLSDPEGLGAQQERVGDEDESLTTHNGEMESEKCCYTCGVIGALWWEKNTDVQ